MTMTTASRTGCRPYSLHSVSRVRLPPQGTPRPAAARLPAASRGPGPASSNPSRATLPSTTSTPAVRLPPSSALANGAAGSARSSGGGSFDLSSGLLEKCFTVALETRLKAWQFIDAKVDCSTFGLLGGSLNGFLVRGLGWITPQGMSLRLFEVSLGETKIDIGTALATQQICFTSVPTGRARLVFNRQDFGNLFRHPLLLREASTAVQGMRFDFDPSNVVIDTMDGSDGSIQFSGVWAGDSQRYDVVVQPDRYGKVRVRASASHLDHGMAFTNTGTLGNGDASDIVAQDLASFFNNLSLDLDGPVMSFNSMQVRKGRDSEVIDMRLNLKLRKMPPLDISF